MSDVHNSEFWFDLSCRTCGFSEACGLDGAQRRLLSVGMLRRNREPTPEEVRELLLAVAPRLPCPGCGASGLLVELDDDVDWPQSAACEGCGEAIPPERLEVFPETTLCVACQSKTDQGQRIGEVIYCPKCGSPMIERTSGGAGLTRYELACSNYPQCRGKA